MSRLPLDRRQPAVGIPKCYGIESFASELPGPSRTTLAVASLIQVAPRTTELAPIALIAVGTLGALVHYSQSTGGIGFVLDVFILLLFAYMVANSWLHWLHGHPGRLAACGEYENAIATALALASCNTPGTEAFKWVHLVGAATWRLHLRDLPGAHLLMEAIPPVADLPYRIRPWKLAVQSDYLYLAGSFADSLVFEERLQQQAEPDFFRNERVPKVRLAARLALTGRCDQAMDAVVELLDCSEAQSQEDFGQLKAIQAKALFGKVALDGAVSATADVPATFLSQEPVWAQSLLLELVAHRRWNEARHLVARLSFDYMSPLQCFFLRLYGLVLPEIASEHAAEAEALLGAISAEAELRDVHPDVQLFRAAIFLVAGDERSMSSLLDKMIPDEACLTFPLSTTLGFLSGALQEIDPGACPVFSQAVVRRMQESGAMTEQLASAQCVLATTLLFAGDAEGAYATFEEIGPIVEEHYRYLSLHNRAWALLRLHRASETAMELVGQALALRPKSEYSLNTQLCARVACGLIDETVYQGLKRWLDEHHDGLPLDRCFILYFTAKAAWILGLTEEFAALKVKVAEFPVAEAGDLDRRLADLTRHSSR